MRSHTVPAATLLVALATLAAPGFAVASLDTSIVAVVPTRTDPRIVLDPSSHAPHLLYVNGGNLVHAFRSGDVWTEELVASTITPQTGSRGWAGGASGRWSAAFIRLGNRFVCSVREAGGWVEDSSLIEIGTSTPVALAADPATGEPRVAYARVQNPPAGATHVVCWASRNGSTWTITEVDSISTGAPSLTLAIAPSGRAHLGYLDGGNYVVAREGAGGFEREIAITRGLFLPSLAVDPTTEETRVAFVTQDTLVFGADSSFDLAVGYAERAGGLWTYQRVDSLMYYVPFGLSLRSSAGGDPALVYTRSVNILALDSVPGARPPTPEGGVTTDEVWFATRARGPLPAPFLLERIESHNTLSNGGSLAIGTTGQAYVALRSPDFSAQYHILIAAGLAFSSAPETTPGGFELAPSAPNPILAGHTGTVAFTLPRETWITIELFDLAGARRASTAPRVYPAGNSLVPWAPRDLLAGLYWLRVRTGLGQSATRKWVVL